MSTENPDAPRPSRSRSADSRRRTLASARSSDSSARWASGSPGTSVIVARDHRATGGRDEAGVRAVRRRRSVRRPGGLAPVERGDDPSAAASGARAEPCRRARAASRAARRGSRRSPAGDPIAAGAVDEAAERVERRAAAGEHDDARARAACSARGEARRGRASSARRQRAQPATAQRELERLGVQRRRRRGRALASKTTHALLARRGRRDAPARRPASRSPSARRSRTRASADAVASASASTPGEQDLLDGALDRADREALLEDAVGLVLVEALKRAAQARRARPGRRRARARRRSPRTRSGSPRTPRAAPRSRQGRTGGGRRRCAAGSG